MRRVVFIIVTVHISVLATSLFAGEQPVAEDELTKLKREYADVLTLQGTAKAEILAIAKILCAKPAPQVVVNKP